MQATPNQVGWHPSITQKPPTKMRRPDPMQRMNQMVHFQKNLALLGAALMMLMIPRPWPLGLGTFVNLPF